MRTRLGRPVSPHRQPNSTGASVFISFPGPRDLVAETIAEIAPARKALLGEAAAFDSAQPYRRISPIGGNGRTVKPVSLFLVVARAFRHIRRV